MNLAIKANDRVLLVGKTGSGKTWLAQKLLASVPRLVVIDTKSTLKSWGLKQPTDLDWYKFTRGGQGRFRILAPITDDPAAWYEELFQRLYDAGSLTLYIDEIYGVIPPGARSGKWLNALYTRGRELGVGVWACTQRPTWIPMFLMSESEWIIAFKLNLKADRLRMVEILGDQVSGRIPDKHGFWLYHVEDEKPTYYSTAVLKSGSGV